MGARARMALVMRYYSDMSYDEIADQLGVRRQIRGSSAAARPARAAAALAGNVALAAGGRHERNPTTMCSGMGTWTRIWRGGTWMR